MPMTAAPYYQDECCTIYHADCREIIPHLEPVDLVLTDPPYGIGFKSHGQLFKRAVPIAQDHSVELAMWICDWSNARGIATACFYSPFAPLAVKWRSVLIWAKGAHVGIGGDRETCWKRDHEMIGIINNRILNGARDSSVIFIPALSPPPSGHVAEKPLKLLNYLISKLTNVGHLVLDPFMGSGTTLRAAKNLSRKAIGIELEEKYCEIAANRLRQEVLPMAEANNKNTQENLPAGDVCQ
jgi:DNA modification methylase